MELKPENKSIDGVQSIKVDAPKDDVSKVDASSESLIEQHAVVSTDPSQSLNHSQGDHSTRDSIQNTSHNTDPSVSLGSPMSTSSLPLSPTQTPTNAQRPGERLRQARLLKNRDLKEIASELNISERLLTAIEADDYKSLPEPAFIRGYLRGYGRLLDIDSDSLIAQFNEIYTSATGLSSNHSLENSPLQQLAKLTTRSRKNNRWMWWLLVPVALIVLFLMLLPIMKKFMGSSAADTSAAQTVVLTDSSQFGSSTTGSALPPASSLPHAPLPPVATTQNTSDQLVLTLSKSSNVIVQDSTGKTLVSGTQGTEKPLTLTGSSPFSITLADAASVKLTLNNEKIDLTPYTVDGHASFRLSP